MIIIYILLVGIITGVFSAFFFAFVIGVKEYLKSLNELKNIKNEK